MELVELYNTKNNINTKLWKMNERKVTIKAEVVQKATSDGKVMPKIRGGEFSRTSNEKCN